MGPAVIDDGDCGRKRKGSPRKRRRANGEVEDDGASSIGGRRRHQICQHYLGWQHHPSSFIGGDRPSPLKV